MSDVVEAALVGVGGSVIVAVVGFLTNYFTTRRQIAGAHQASVWEKQATTYADAITAIRYQQERRRRDALAAVFKVAPDPTEPDRPPVRWTDMQGRLFAFASPAVLVAVKAASGAGNEAAARYGQWAALQAQADNIRAAGGPVLPADIAGLAPAVEALKKAVQEANAKDDAIIEAIRVDLLGERGRALHLLSPQEGNQLGDEQAGG
jgi:hypothetical protein